MSKDIQFMKNNMPFLAGLLVGKMKHMKDGRTPDTFDEALIEIEKTLDAMTEEEIMSNAISKEAMTAYLANIGAAYVLIKYDEVFGL